MDLIPVAKSSLSTLMDPVPTVNLEAKSRQEKGAWRLIYREQAELKSRDDPSTIEKLAKNKQKPITPETAEKLARDLKATKYVECSALTQKGLKNVFDEAILAALEPPELKSHSFQKVNYTLFSANEHQRTECGIATGHKHLDATVCNFNVYGVPRCPSTEEWIKKMWYIYTMEYYSAEKNNDIMKFAGKWMELENVILSK
ncbi:hypothetical protein STEG23_030195, partial [Scotinomys teguina]